MKSISGPHWISPSPQSLEDPNSRQSVSTEPAGSKRTSSQANLQGEVAKQSKRLRTPRHGMGANSASLLQRQLVNEYNAKPGAPAASITFPNLTKPVTRPTPSAPQWDNDADFDGLPPIVELDIDQNEQALLSMMAEEPVDEVAGVDPRRPWPQQAPLDPGLDDLHESDQFLEFLDDGISPAEERALRAMMANDVPFTEAASPFEWQILMGMDAEYEADDVLYRLERPFTGEQEQALQTMMAEDLLNEADEVDAARPGPQQAPTAAYVKPPAEATTPAENLANQLQHLGYSKNQANAIEPTSRSVVLMRHAALRGFGFGFHEICCISKNVLSLHMLAKNHEQLRIDLPNLTQREMVDIAMQPTGNWALEALLHVAKDLKEKPPHLNDQQLALIAKNGKRPALWAVHSLGQKLSGQPYDLKPAELASIASKRSGVTTLKELIVDLPKLLASPHHYSRDEVVRLADQHYGYKSLKKIIPPEEIHLHRAQGDPGFSFPDRSPNSASAVPHQAPPGKYQHLRTSLPSLSSSEIMDIAKEPSGEWTLKVLLDVAKDLKEKPPHLNDQQLAVIAKMGKWQALLAVHSLGQELSVRPYYLRPEQLVSVACNRSFELALKTIQLYLPVLVEEPYGLAHDKVVAIATSRGGVQVLEAIRKHLPKLVKAPYDLAVEQVVAMASHGAGRQALEAVNDYLPELVNTPDGLTCKQVVAIAISTGGAQLLEATKHHLAKLLKPPYGLISHHVVAIATKGGGKPGLEAVIEYLPKLLGAPFGMTRQQVVGLASRPNGKWMLEEIVRTKKVP